MSPEDLYQANEKIALYVLWRYFPSIACDEDVQQLAKMSLWQACRRYISGQAAFSTYATQSVKNEILCMLKKQNRLMRKGNAIPLEDLRPEQERLDWAELLPGDPDVQWLDWNGFLSALTERQRRIVDLRLEGHSVRAIGKILGVSGMAVSQSLQKIRKVFDLYI